MWCKTSHSTGYKRGDSPHLEVGRTSFPGPTVQSQSSFPSKVPRQSKGSLGLAGGRACPTPQLALSSAAPLPCRLRSGLTSQVGRWWGFVLLLPEGHPRTPAAALPTCPCNQRCPGPSIHLLPLLALLPSCRKLTFRPVCGSSGSQAGKVTGSSANNAGPGPQLLCVRLCCPQGRESVSRGGGEAGLRVPVPRVASFQRRPLGYSTVACSPNRMRSVL